VEVVVEIELAEAEAAAAAAVVVVVVVVVAAWLGTELPCFVVQENWRLFSNAFLCGFELLANVVYVEASPLTPLLPSISAGKHTFQMCILLVVWNQSPRNECTQHI